MILAHCTQLATLINLKFKKEVGIAIKSMEISSYGTAHF